MTTHDHNPLAAQFAALAPEPLPGNWNDVLNRAGAVRPRRRRVAWSLWRGGRRRKLVVALAAAVVVAAVGTAAYGTVRVLFFDRGFIGLPPVGATPSPAGSGEIVISYQIPWPETDALGSLREASVYADGRLLWLRERARIPEAASLWSSGYLEQRLTPEGVELLRSEILSTGLFGHDQAFVHAAARRWNGAHILVRNGDRMVHVSTASACIGPYPCALAPGLTPATPEQTNVLYQLAGRLRDPASWLPASAWEVSELRAYVPSRYVISYGWTEAARVLPLLPVQARSLLRGKEVRILEHSSGVDRVLYEHYSELTSEEARALANAFDEAGLEHPIGRQLFYVVESSGSTEHIRIEPILPNGEFPCSVCG
jgi:hypothetical protein